MLVFYLLLHGCASRFLLFIPLHLPNSFLFICWNLVNQYSRVLLQAFLWTSQQKQCVICFFFQCGYDVVKSLQITVNIRCNMRKCNAFLFSRYLGFRARCAVFRSLFFKHLLQEGLSDRWRWFLWPVHRTIVVCLRIV